MEVITAAAGGDFEFSLEGNDKVWALPAWDRLPFRFALELAACETPLEQAQAVAGLIDRECPGLLDELTSAQVGALLTAWRGGGATMGESPASPE